MQWEGLKLKAYRCSAGVWTIGYGHTRTAFPGMIIDRDEAEALLRDDLSDAERAVSRLITVPLNDNQFAVLVSFTFNLGFGNLEKSTLRRKLNAGEYEAVPTELMKWVNAGGKRLQGLVNRRAAEAGLWVKGAHVDSRDVVPIPPEKPLTQSKEIAAGAVGLAGVAAEVAAEAGPLQALVPENIGLYILLFVALMVILNRVMARKKGER